MGHLRGIPAKMLWNLLASVLGSRKKEVVLVFIICSIFLVIG